MPNFTIPSPFSQLLSRHPPTTFSHLPSPPPTFSVHTPTLFLLDHHFLQTFLSLSSFTASSSPLSEFLSNSLLPFIHLSLPPLRPPIQVSDADLHSAGRLFFHFVDDPPTLEVHVFTADSFRGQIAESDEMRPCWFPKDKIPFDQMWKDDRLWFPLFFQNKLFKGDFTFQGHETILKYMLNEVESL